MLEDSNPYASENGKPELQNSVVAFVDLLGYQQLIRDAHANSTATDLLTRLHQALKAATRHLSELDEEGNPYLPADTWIGRDRYKIRTFTDNIVIGYPIYEDGEVELGAIFSKLSFFQLEMVNHGFFVRGAVAIGDLYIDDITVFGNGLLDAYDGESKDARDPRIILTESATSAVNKHVQYYGNPSHSPQARELYRDADGQFFLNYLESILIAEDEHGPFYDVLESHKASVQSKLIEYQKQPAYWAKYAWSAGYHNYFCDQYHHFTEDHKINVSQFQMQPTSIV